MERSPSSGPSPGSIQEAWRSPGAMGPVGKGLSPRVAHELPELSGSLSCPGGFVHPIRNGNLRLRGASGPQSPLARSMKSSDEGGGLPVVPVDPRWLRGAPSSSRMTRASGRLGNPAIPGRISPPRSSPANRPSRPDRLIRSRRPGPLSLQHRLGLLVRKAGVGLWCRIRVGLLEADPGGPSPPGVQGGAKRKTASRSYRGGSEQRSEERVWGKHGHHPIHQLHAGALLGSAPFRIHRAPRTDESGIRRRYGPSTSHRSSPAGTTERASFRWSLASAGSLVKTSRFGCGLSGPLLARLRASGLPGQTISTSGGKLQGRPVPEEDGEHIPLPDLSRSGPAPRSTSPHGGGQSPGSPMAGEGGTKDHIPGVRVPLSSPSPHQDVPRVNRRSLGSTKATLVSVGTPPHQGGTGPRFEHLHDAAGADRPWALPSTRTTT